MLVLFFLFSFNLNISYGKFKDEKITVVIDENYPPYSFYKGEGELQGICVDLWHLYEDKTGIEVELVSESWNDALNAMKNRQYDVIDTPTYCEERDQYLDFSMPYASVNVLIFFYDNISGITDVKSLEGFTVGVIEGAHIIHVLEKNGITNLKTFRNPEELILAAKEQKIVTFVMEEAPAFYYLYKYNLNDQYNYTKPLFKMQLFRAVQSGEKRLLKKINDGFDLISQEENQAIMEKWHGINYNTKVNKKLLKIIFYSMIITCTVLIFLFVWNRALSIKVKKKTKELSDTIQVLKESEAKNKALIKAFPDTFVILNNQHSLLDYHVPDHQDNYAIIDLKQRLEKSVDDELADKFKSGINEAFKSGEVVSLEYNFLYEREKRHYEARIAPINDDRMIIVNRDITERKKAEERFYYASIHDSLTGVYNRYYYESEIKRIEENGVNTFCAVVVDVDGLKLINDTLGHYMGDLYLKKVSKLLMRAFPDDSIICRIGGDEFCVILKDKLEKEIELYIKIFKYKAGTGNQDNELPISISLGYSYSDEKNIDCNERIKEADNRMYREKLHRKQSTRSEIVQAMKHMFEARDFISEGHATRMQELVEQLSKAAGIPESETADIKLLAQFHDIGKVGIPDYVLFKTSELTKDEYELMKRHTEIGHRIAISSADLLPIAEGILKHHEHWDGSGYPFGLKREEIPLECRILSIADAFDAMTNDRPYRKAIDQKDAISELKRCAGTQFDPVLVEKFIQIIENESIKKDFA